ncbi:MAG: ATP-dependent RecD-like DNA helicase [Saprospiraceae bacterium]
MIDKEPIQLSKEYQYTLDLLEKTNQSAFITGRAGTGKSTLLQLFRNTTKKRAVVLAPTGVAALNVKGQTIHSFFGFPGKPLQKSDIRRRRYRKMFEKLEVLIIDEISMVRADMMDNIDYFLRLNRHINQPFGGVQVVFFGDLFQLPPVVATEEEHMLFRNYYDSPYFFSAKVFVEDQFEMEKIELRTTYRQSSRHFVRLLDAVRLNQIDYEDLDDLNERYFEDFEAEDYYITLSARNKIANEINRAQLARLQTPVFSYRASITGEFNPRLFPTELDLDLRLGAQVMFVKNDPQKKFVNGSIGKIMELTEDNIKVALQNDDGTTKLIDVEKLEWEILKYKTPEDDVSKIESNVVGTFKQYPLKLAWAITIHKSQGKTFDKVIINMGAKGAFEHGQTYVALSRCRTLEGVVLKKKLTPRDIMVDERIVEYYEQNF